MLAVGSTDDKKGSYAIQVDNGSAECGAYVALESSRKVGAAAITSRLHELKAQREDADVEIEVLDHGWCTAASKLAQRIKCLANGRRDVIKRNQDSDATGSTGEVTMISFPPSTGAA